MTASRKQPGWLATAGRLVLAALVLAGGVLLVYWRLLLTNRVLGSGDALTYFTPYRDFANAALRSGHLPLWNPYLFLGVPFLANPQSAVLYPLHWPFIWLPAARSLIASLALHLWLAGLGATIYSRRVLRLGWLSAVVTGLLFSLSGYLGAHAGQINQVSAAAWLPWLLWLLEEAAAGQASEGIGGEKGVEGGGRRINLVALAGLTTVMALQLLAGHMQVAYMSLVALGLAAIWPGLVGLGSWAWRRWHRRPGKLKWPVVGQALHRLGLMLAAGLLGGLLAAAQLLPTWELAQQSVRSGGLPYREVVSFSLRPRGLLLGLLPTYGESLAGHFATPAFAEFVAYLSAGALVLAALTLIHCGRRSSVVQWLSSPIGLALGLIGVGLALALGLYNPLYFVLYKLVPGFDLFRAPARWLLLYTFGLAVLAGVGLQITYQSTSQPTNQPTNQPRALHNKRLGLVALAVLALLAWQYRPAWWVMGLWVGAGGLVAWLARRRGRWMPLLIAGVLTAELVGGSLSLDHTRPTAPEAVTSLRTAPAHLLAMARQEQAAGRIPGRFLSLSGITYDPGDLPEMEQMLAGQLPSQAVYDFVVASKLQEIVAPNLSLLWRLPAVDGYDGGVLPLRRYVDLQTLFLPREQLAADGRLREQLQVVPPSRLLNLLGVEHVITDKVFDVWMDDVYYDLELSTRLAPGQSVAVEAEGRLESTAIGLFTHLEGGADLAPGTAVGEVTVIGENGERWRFVLRAGQETAEGAWSASASHPQPSARQPWPRHQAGWDYLARFELPSPLSPQRVVVANITARARLVVRGISLIDGRTGAHAALTIPADGSFQRVHSGDVKIYRNLTALPRVYVVGQAVLVADDDAALAALGDAAFDPASAVVLLEGEVTEHGLKELAARMSSIASGAAVTVEEYGAERVALHVELPAPAALVLSDTWYPGWQAMVDGDLAPVLRANLLFRAVLLPAGFHQVVFEFRPASLRWGARISGIGLGLLGVLLSAGLMRRALRAYPKTAPAPRPRGRRSARGRASEQVFG